MNLNGKKVLFIGPRFFGYEQEIKKEIKNLGAEVDFFPEKDETMIYRIAKNFSSSWFETIKTNYLNFILKKVTKDYDYFFLIRGEIITKVFLKKLKEKLPNAKFIMYQWDSSKNNPNYLQIMDMFDKVTTFDMVDAKKLNIYYLPLFYISSYQNLKLNDTRKYDIVFFGSYHGDRLDIIKKVDEECERLKLSFKYHLYISKLALIKKIFSRTIKLSDLIYFSTKGVNNIDIIEHYKKTKSVLDIESYGQNGLTMRTFEVLGSGLKLITTNSNIKNESFYNERYIFILDRNEIGIKNEMIFNDNDNNDNNDNNINNYSIESWIKIFFNDIKF